MDDTSHESDGGSILVARAYQIEMLRDSVQRNIIIAIETGSGKTQMRVIASLEAVLRIAYELERCSPEKLVWFLCPTVALVQQQHKVISTQLPLFQSIQLSGNDGIDHWSTQKIWDDALTNIRIIVCTHQVLLDALIHGFVQMARIALLVFDEAHHCVKNHAANRIMQGFYHAAKTGPLQVPHILGLSASPVVRNRGGGLRLLEQNMHAIGKTPKIHRTEYLQHVQRPQMDILIYPPNDDSAKDPPLFTALTALYLTLDIEADPYVMKLKASGVGMESKQLFNAVMSHKTFCQAQLKGFVNMAFDIKKELGYWACQYYIESCVSKIRARPVDAFLAFADMDETEKSYLARVLSQLEISLLLAGEPSDHEISSKTIQLIETLLREVHSGFAGLVFVKTRATVKLLCHLLSVYPRTRDLFRVGTFVGMSSNDHRKAKLADIADIGNQHETLNDLRSGTKNLLITTSVLEEGIDVSACNVVICFEKPPNLKSFIQRRGRARQAESKYILMFDHGSEPAVDLWQQLEEEMKHMYMDDSRDLEDGIEEMEQAAECREFVIESTSAKLTLKDSVQHLHHFCGALPQTPYAVSNPVFIFSTHEHGGRIRAKVILPNSVDVSVREFEGRGYWKTERNARSDVAFEAYIGLYNAGLVNEHLLPLVRSDDAAAKAYSAIQKRPSMVAVRDQVSIWPAFAKTWQSAQIVYESKITFKCGGEQSVSFMLVSPLPLLPTESFKLFVDSTTILDVSMEDEKQLVLDEIEVSVLQEITNFTLGLVPSRNMRSDDFAFPLLFGPMEFDHQNWLQHARATDPASLDIGKNGLNLEMGLVRDASGTPYICHGIEQDYNLTDREEPVLKVAPLPKRTDFLHVLPTGQAKRKSSGFVYLSPDKCTIDRLPMTFTRFSMLIPSIMQRIERSLLIKRLCEGLLGPIQFGNIDLVTTAVTAALAQEGTNYQRLEFLGDGVLKMLTAVAIMADHPKWHEGYLSGKKDHTVSNGRLALAAQHTGLDEYIRDRLFTGYKWQPLYNKDLLQIQPVGNRELSTKTLADVVEALIGAAFLDSGIPGALKCLSIFLPEISWLPLSDRNASLSEAASALPGSIIIPPHFQELEKLICYKFKNPLLMLEAMTHPSYIGTTSAASLSYQRLEFLGDAILDYIVTSLIFESTNPLPVLRMHLIRSAVVNANFLAFLGLKLHTTIARSEIRPQPSNLGSSPTIIGNIPISIWHFTRTSYSHDFTRAQKASLKRFSAVEDSLSTALAHSDNYPWTALISFGPEKFFSDIIESLIAAIYIDTSGSFEACAAFLTTLGVIPYLKRVLAEEVKVWHPKEELGVLAGNDKVRYAAQTLDDGWASEVFVGERRISGVKTMRTKYEAETRAAEEAVRVLTRERTLSGVEVVPEGISQKQELDRQLQVGRNLDIEGEPTIEADGNAEGDGDDEENDDEDVLEASKGGGLKRKRERKDGDRTVRN